MRVCSRCRRFRQQTLPSSVRVGSPSAWGTWSRLSPCLISKEGIPKTQFVWTDRSRPPGLHRPFDWTLVPADHLLHGVGCRPPHSCPAGERLQHQTGTRRFKAAAQPLSCCLSVSSCTLPPSPGPPLTPVWREAWATGWCTPTLPWPGR